MTWLKNIGIKILRKVFKRKKAGIILAGYFNGLCPVCESHIGTDIFKDKVTQQHYAFCGHCGREIFGQLDQKKIMFYAPGRRYE